MSRLLDRIRIGARNPRLAYRYLRGENVNRRPDEIDLDEIGVYLPPDPVILEAGALDGTDTLRMASQWPAGRIHAFEPVPDACEILRRNTRHLTNVSTYMLGLSDRTGTAILHLSADANGQFRPDSSSLLPPAAHLQLHPDVTFGAEIPVQVTTLNDWSVRLGIAQVDFMWLDLQGMELAVLLASPGFAQRATAICTEVVTEELYEGCPLYPEVRDSMRSLGFEPAIERIAGHSGNVLFVSDSAGPHGPWKGSRRGRST